MDLEIREPDRFPGPLSVPLARSPSLSRGNDIRQPDDGNHAPKGSHRDWDFLSPRKVVR